MTFDEVLILLRSGGVDVEHFDANGHKTLQQLYQELQERDVKLCLNSLGQVVRSAVSVKILMITTDNFWIEVAREFPDGHIEEQLKDHTLSETMKEGEKPLNCAIRCLAEEAKYYLSDPSELTDVSILGERSSHASSVYPGIISDVSICRYEWRPKEFTFPEQGFISDGRVKLHLRCISNE